MHSFIVYCWITPIIWFVAVTQIPRILQSQYRWSWSQIWFQSQALGKSRKVIAGQKSASCGEGQWIHWSSPILYMHYLYKPIPSSCKTKTTGSVLCQWMSSKMMRIPRRKSPFPCCVLWLWHLCTATDEVVACRTRHLLLWFLTTWRRAEPGNGRRFRPVAEVPKCCFLQISMWNTNHSQLLFSKSQNQLLYWYFFWWKSLISD